LTLTAVVLPDLDNLDGLDLDLDIDSPFNLKFCLTSTLTSTLIAALILTSTAALISRTLVSILQPP
jgi:hypothetical protein